MKKTIKAEDAHFEDVPLPTTKKSSLNNYDEKPLPSKVDHYQVPEDIL